MKDKNTIDLLEHLAEMSRIQQDEINKANDIIIGLVIFEMITFVILLIALGILPN